MATGVRSLDDLREQNARRLADAMLAANATHRITRLVPSAAVLNVASSTSAAAFRRVARSTPTAPPRLLPKITTGTALVSVLPAT